MKLYSTAREKSNRFNETSAFRISISGSPRSEGDSFQEENTLCGISAYPLQRNVLETIALRFS